MIRHGSTRSEYLGFLLRLTFGSISGSFFGTGWTFLSLRLNRHRSQVNDSVFFLFHFDFIFAGSDVGNFFSCLGNISIISSDRIYGGVKEFYIEIPRN